MPYNAIGRQRRDGQIKRKPEVIKEYFQIKDRCRKGLIKHLGKAFSVIPEIENPKILDIGCGTGVPILWIADNYPGTMVAIDSDKSAVEWLQSKISDNNFVENNGLESIILRL